MIVTHGGIGSIITPLKMGKPVIVVPRLKKLNEHNDDHQLQITQELERQKKILAVYDISKLEAAIGKAKKLRPQKFAGGNKITGIIEKYIQMEFGQGKL